ncbi:MAG: hypothetical protein QW520_05845 [Methanomassiliicoccales archaeon]
MQLYDFGRIERSKVRIPERIGRLLGLVDGSQAFSALFRYEHNGHVSHEIVLSTIGPEDYREICNVTFYLIDVPGACAQVAKFLGERNIDILNSVSLSMISEVCMVWKMMVDLSYYGEPASLKEEFEALKRQRSASLSKVDSMLIEHSRINDRYTKGVVPSVSTIKVKAVKRAQKGPGLIRNMEFEIPSEYLAVMEGVRDGTPVIMVADQDSWVLSISPLKEGLRMVQMDFLIPDRPGAIGEVMALLADQDINLMSVKTKVLIYYESMSMAVVADISKYKGDGLDSLRSIIEEHLSHLKGNFKLTSLRAVEP